MTKSMPMLRPMPKNEAVGKNITKYVGNYDRLKPRAYTFTALSTAHYSGIVGWDSWTWGGSMDH